MWLWNRNWNKRTLFLALPLFCDWKTKTSWYVYDKHFSSQNLNKESMIDILMGVISSMNVTTKKFYFIQLIILDLLNVLKDHLLTTAYSKFILILLLLFNFVNLFFFLLPSFSILTFFPNWNKCLTFCYFIRVGTAF